MKKKIISTILIFCSTVMPVLAYTLDTSVDEEIRRQFDAAKLQYDVMNNNIESNLQVNKTNQKKVDVPKNSVLTTKADQNYNKKLPQWTTFNVKSDQAISGYTQKGTRISFTSVENIYKKEVTIPAGTKFYGTIVNSHPAQRTGNGALVVLKVDLMSYNGTNYQIDGKITKATSKKIFLNNIKGQRQYLTGVGKQINKGEEFYKKARKVSYRMSDNPILVILAPVPTVVGILGYSCYTVLSPITALATKGGNLTLPAGSTYQIKLLDTIYVR